MATAVPLAGVAGGQVSAPEKLNGPLGPGSKVFDFDVSPDGKRIAYRAGTTHLVELYAGSTDGSGTPVKLNGPIVEGGSVREGYEISPDGRRVVFRADAEVDTKSELYSRRIDGTGALAKINGPDTSVADDVAITPDGSRVVWRGETFDDERTTELYSRRIDGSGPRVKLNGPLPHGPGLAGGDVRQLALTPNGNRVVYQADQATDDVFELYSVPVTGGPRVKLNGPLVPGGDAGNFLITPDGSRVVYAADQDSDDVVELYSVPVTGGPSTKLNGPLPAGGDVQLFDVTPDGSSVIYTADQHANDVIELYTRPVDGSRPPIKLNGPLVAGGDVSGLAASRTTNRVVYTADQDTNDVIELYSRPVDPSGPPVKLSGHMAPGGDIDHFTISPNGRWVAYRADQAHDGVFELYSRQIDGSGRLAKLNGPLVAGGDVFGDVDAVGYQFSPDSTQVVYEADQDTDDLKELYARPVGGSASPVKLSGQMAPGIGVERFEVGQAGSPPALRVVYTANQLAASKTELFVVTHPPASSAGYWLVEQDGDLVAFGDAPVLPSAKPDLVGATAVAMAAHPDGDGVWVLGSNGDIIARGSATDLGAVDLTQLTKPDEEVATLSATPDGDGLWVFTTAGRILALGTATPGDQMAGADAVLALTLDGPIVDSVATPTGQGAYLVASDGGVFAVGDATFIQSVRGALTELNGPPGLPDQPVVGIVPDPDGTGYWNVAADGGVFAFDAPFRGSLPAIVAFDQLLAPINGMVPYGNGYLLVASDGGVFTFSNLPFEGSASGHTDTPIVDIATRT